MKAMSEIIHFQQRMRFSALRSFNAKRGVGGVVAVFFTPECAAPTHGTPPPTNEAVALHVVVAHVGLPTDQQTASYRRGDGSR